MIDTLFFVLQLSGIVVLLAWALAHDRLAEGTPTRGPLAFKQHDRNPPERARSRETGVGLTRRRSRSNLEKRRR